MFLYNRDPKQQEESTTIWKAVVWWKAITFCQSVDELLKSRRFAVWVLMFRYEERLEVSYFFKLRASCARNVCKSVRLRNPYEFSLPIPKKSPKAQETLISKDVSLESSTKPGGGGYFSLFFFSSTNGCPPSKEHFGRFLSARVFTHKKCPEQKVLPTEGPRKAYNIIKSRLN